MIKISLPTFLKIASKKEASKPREYAKLLEKKGFAYYHAFTQAVELATWKGADIEAARQKISSIGHLSRKNHSDIVFKNFEEMFLGKGFKFLEPPSAEYISPLKNFSLSIRPPVYFDFDGKRYIVLLWMVEKPKLETRIASIGVDIMCKAFDGHKIDRYVYADLRNKSWLEASGTSRPASALAASEIAFCDAIFDAPSEEAAA